jgi:S1-C subfamily serine protease
MHRALVAAVLLALPILLQGQPTAVLRIVVSLPDETRQPIPVGRHALLVSDNPSTTVPRRVLTGPDGSVEVQLAPGNYTVESDRPVTFAGKAYQWTMMVDVLAGGRDTLALTADNAEVVPVTGPGTPEGGEPRDAASSFLPAKWHDSVVAVWSPTARATGFVFDSRGLIATHGAVARNETTVAVQVSGEVKVPATVLFADPACGVTILWVHPSVIAGRAPVPVNCPASRATTLSEGQEITTITALLGQPANSTSGEVTGFTTRVVDTDLRLGFGGTGGPVFNAAGILVGLTWQSTGADTSQTGDATIVRAASLCDAVAAAEPKLSGAAPPAPTRLPVEPARPHAARALASADGGTTLPMVSSSDFDITFLTPSLLDRARQDPGRTGGRNARSPEAEARLGRLTDVGAWSGYFSDRPAVLVVRVSPKLVEGFWKRLAREAARTQGAVLPPFKDFTTSFVRMRASCGNDEIAPIQPFVLEHRISDTKVVREGLYVFDPGAFRPTCGRVTLSIYSEKAPGKADTVTVDAAALGIERVP